MNKEWLIKTLVIGIILLTIFMSINPSLAVDNIKKSSMPVSNGNILYVGGYGEDNYTKIQDAIDNASDGDTVFVFDDSSPYYEHLIVNKSINLIGENRDTTIIDGNGWGIIMDLLADGVIISGFTITGGGYTKALFVNSKNNTITCNNFISNTWIAILITGESNKITNNTIDDNYHTGVYVESSSRNNFIYNNTIQNCGQNGIYLGSSRNNIISGNTIINCELENIGLGCGKNNEIINNTISVGRHPGISLVGTDYTIISGNDISGFSAGISLNNARNNKISNNIIHDNYNWGIDFYGSSFNTISQNQIKNNGVGISLSWSDNNTLHSNIILWSSNGIYIYGSNNSIFHNNFIKNKINAKDNSQWENFWDDGYPSGGNYWDDYTGEDKNNDSIGDTPYPIPESINKDMYPLMEPYGEIPLMIRFVKPEYHFLYILNLKLLYLYPDNPTVIFGKITIKIEVLNSSLVEKVELYIDGDLEKTFLEEPYHWIWHKRTFFEHSLKTVVYDSTGNIATVEMNVWRFL
jgi:parallel beta-helix repeat protein